jgi:hypothetical protein
MPGNTRTEISFNDGGILEIYHVDTGKKETDRNGGGMRTWGILKRQRLCICGIPPNRRRRQVITSYSPTDQGCEIIGESLVGCALALGAYRVGSPGGGRLAV